MDRGPEPGTIKVPVPHDVRPEWSTATVPVHDWILTSWVQGRQTYRYGVYDMRTGEWRVLAGLRGILTDALPLGPGRALVLTEYVLAEVDLVSLAIARLTGKVSAHSNHLRRIDADIVAVGNRRKTIEALVSVADLTVQARRRRPDDALLELPADAAIAGACRPLHRTDDLLLAASGPYPGPAQQLLVFAADTMSLLASVDFPAGLASARTVPGAIIAAGPHMGRAPQISSIPWSGSV